MSVSPIRVQPIVDDDGTLHRSDDDNALPIAIPPPHTPGHSLAAPDDSALPSAKPTLPTAKPPLARASWKALLRWCGTGALLLFLAFQHSTLFPAMKRCFQAYEAAAISRPILTKGATSGVAYLAGDAIAQRLARTRDTGRLARAGIAGAVSHGPQLHAWTMLLERCSLPLVAKVALDQTIFSLYLNAAFCVCTESLQRRPLAFTLRKARAAAWPCLKAGWRFWPLAHAFTYSVVPLHLRVLWVDALEVGWVAILSTCVARAQGRGAGGACEDPDGTTEPAGGAAVPSPDRP